MMIVDQNDTIDAYIVILLSYLHTLERRVQARLRRPKKFIFWQSEDALSLSMSDQQLIFFTLVTPLLASFPSPLITTTLDKTPRELLIERASDWAADQLNGYSNSKDDENRKLRRILEACVRLRPDVSNHHYRLAALQCLMNDEAAALASLLKGQALDAQSGSPDGEWIYYWSFARLSLMWENNATAQATAIAYVARGARRKFSGFTKP